MKVLKKMSIFLLSLVIFCGMTITAFARPHVGASVDKSHRLTAYVDIHDGKTYTVRVDAEFYNEKGDLIDVEKDREAEHNSTVEFIWTKRDWYKANVIFYINGHEWYHETVYNN